MAKKNYCTLGDRRDFWNVPCNPITGYRLMKNGLSGYFHKTKEDFFKDTIETKWM